MDLRVGLDGCEKSRPHLDFFGFSVLLCPGFAFCPYCTTQTSMPPAGFEPATPVSDRLQTLVLDRTATGDSTLRPSSS